MQKDAYIDDTGTYRYFLSRIWNPEGTNFMNFIMLNPSTADDKTDDPTIKSCMKIAQSLGYDGIFVTNLFAYRSTDPQKLYDTTLDVVGPENNKFIMEYATKCNCSMLAWGEHGKIKNRYSEVLKLLDGCEIYCLGKNKSGQPKHPLYVRRDVEPIVF